MIDEKIQEAWKTWKDSANVEQLEHAACMLANAYVQAEARARMAEFMIEHAQDTDGQCLACDDLPEMDPRHIWTLADWEKAVREELEHG